MLVIATLLVGSSQVGKFEGRKPEAEYVASARMEDIERCLVRQLSPPQVYRQPDRPDDVMIVWMAGGVSAGSAAARVDLHRSGNNTLVKSWLTSTIVGPCAPQAKDQ